MMGACGKQEDGWHSVWRFGVFGSCEGFYLEGACFLFLFFRRRERERPDVVVAAFFFFSLPADDVMKG